MKGVRDMNYRSPGDIEAESMRIIEREAGPHAFPEDQWQVVRRIIHATADFGFVGSMRLHPEAIAAGVQAIRQGRPVYVDTRMLFAGISRALSETWGCEILCCVADDDVRRESLETGVTRSALAVRKAAPQLQSGVIVIGNAPTALHAAIDLCAQGRLEPALVIGLPVGFVEARESKERLYASSLRWITNLDRKGGTSAAAAAVNALVRLAESD
jgi:precorrin-8X/cobalt-precorrin-8 methylmutase